MTSSADQVASSIGSTRLVEVRVLTKEGALYSFPDMSLEDLRRVLPESGRTPAGMPMLMMVNVSIAVLTLPFRIIKTVEAEGETLWACPA